MRKTRRSKRKGCLIALVIVFAPILCLYTFAEIKYRHRCVQLQNGFLIGPSTFFSEMVGWDIDVSLKFPDGKVLYRGRDNYIGFWNENMIGGRSYSGRKNPHSGLFIYDKDLGLIVAKQNPRLYRQFKIDNEITINRSQQTKTDLGSLFLFLSRNDVEHFNPNYPPHFEVEKFKINYKRSWCPTAWFEPEMADLESISAAQ